MIPAFTTTYHLLLPACMSSSLADRKHTLTASVVSFAGLLRASLATGFLLASLCGLSSLSYLQRALPIPTGDIRANAPTHPSLPPPTTHNPLVGRTDVMKTPLFYLSTLLTVRIRRYLSSNQYIPVKSPLNDNLLICYRLASLVCSFGIPRSWSSTARYRLADRLLGC